MSRSLRDLAPALRPWAQRLVNWAQSAGLRPVVTSTRRSRAEQARLYREYKAGRTCCPVAPPGFSRHELGWAFDLTSIDNTSIGATWARWGGVWAGPGDYVHYETQ